MQAADIMTPNVITATPGSEVGDVANMLLEHGISSVPVVDTDDKVLGIISEGDLMRRVLRDSDHHKSWWLRLLGNGGNAANYVKNHGRRASEIMTPTPITIAENESLHRIAVLFEKRRIKRVPVVRNGKLVGIVSRSNLLHGFSTSRLQSGSGDDRDIRDAILKEIKRNAGILVHRPNVIVTDGKVQLWGLVRSHNQKRAVQVAAERVEGVEEVENNLGLIPQGMGG